MRIIIFCLLATLSIHFIQAQTAPFYVEKSVNLKYSLNTQLAGSEGLVFYILKGIREGKIKPYYRTYPDKLVPSTNREFLERIAQPAVKISEEEKLEMKKMGIEPKVSYYDEKQLRIIQIRQVWTNGKPMIDRVTVVLPVDQSPKGIEEFLFTVKYPELEAYLNKVGAKCTEANGDYTPLDEEKWLASIWDTTLAVQYKTRLKTLKTNVGKIDKQTPITEVINKGLYFYEVTSFPNSKDLYVWDICFEKYWDIQVETVNALGQSKEADVQKNLEEMVNKYWSSCTNK